MRGLICGLGSVWLMEYRYEGVNFWIRYEGVSLLIVFSVADGIWV